jgi:uncharacterized membrane protein
MNLLYLMVLILEIYLIKRIYKYMAKRYRSKNVERMYPQSTNYQLKNGNDNATLKFSHAFRVEF